MQINNLSPPAGHQIYARGRGASTTSDAAVNPAITGDQIEISAAARQAYVEIQAPSILPPRDLPPDPGPDSPIASFSVTPPRDIPPDLDPPPN